MAGFEPAKEYLPGKPLSDYGSGVYASNFIVLALSGFEPPTSRRSGCSLQLSYKAIVG